MNAKQWALMFPVFPATGADTVMAVAYGVEKIISTDPTAIADAIRNADSICNDGRQHFLQGNSYLCTAYNSGNRI